MKKTLLILIGLTTVLLTYSIDAKAQGKSTQAMEESGKRS